MRLLVIKALVFVNCTLPAIAEVVQTTDGRLIELNVDGTYEFLETRGHSESKYLEHQDHYFAHEIAEYGRKRVRFMPIYKNLSENRIVGVKFTARFLNAFGDEIFKFSGEMDEPVSPGRTSTTKLTYFFEDNQFIQNEPYDKLLPMVANKTGSIDVSIDAIAFEDGEIVKFSE